MGKVILTAHDLDGYLTEHDKKHIAEMDEMYKQADPVFEKMEKNPLSGFETGKQALIEIFNVLGDKMQEITAEEPGIHVYSFETPREIHGEASRLIAKLRNSRTPLS